MANTYASSELKEAMEQSGGAPPPDRRTLFYMVTCPTDEQQCSVTECEYGNCMSMTTAEDLDGHLEPTPSIHISPVPALSERHTAMPIDNTSDWHVALAEAARLLDTEHLEELKSLVDQWVMPAEDKTASRILVEAIIGLIEDIDETQLPTCESCGKRHVSDGEYECPGCQRLQDGEAKRYEF